MQADPDLGLARHDSVTHHGAGFNMIEALKSDEIVTKTGGRFKLCALIQRRLVELMDGGRPLVERQGRSDLEVVIDEILSDKIALDLSPENYDGDEPPSLTR